MPFHRAQIRCVLTIAGSDSGGGAGLQADLKTFLSHNVHGTVAVTCVTAQNTLGVSGIERISSHLVQAQIEAVLDDLAPEAAKTGFLAGLAAIEAVEALADRLPPLVVDPVCVDKYGRKIVDDPTLEAIRRVLIPRATVVTPNVAEAAVLTGRSVESPADMENAAEALLYAGARAVLIKGGRLGTDRSPDLFACSDGSREWLDIARVATTAVLGTGDTLAAAIASRLAWGVALPDAVRLAKAYVTSCLEMALEIGQGQGPIGHVPAASLD
ncbi:MAG: phosphomethylpyrimidine kinase [Chloroflexi bacterium]|jgi:hydroxymethylpyrimidine/phosphomethylpyrimidine kinase|nr:phosphomethylpyrimidine kinase [Chloroflexota bacterium]